ncbi:MAG TPA: hypothetical protein VEL03_14955 [Streptosporangiaceae bacterium]|nr:hypothetical protein [Streptosporangiaceae bacterium]
MNSHSYTPRFQLKAAPMMAGIVLLGTGCLMGIAGMIIGGSAVMSGTRRWFRGIAEEYEALHPAWGKQTKVAMTTARDMNGHRARARSGHV